MSTAVAVTVLNTALLPYSPDSQGTTPAGSRMMMAFGTLAMPTSYTTGGAPVDLSPWFDNVDHVDINPMLASANLLNYVKGARNADTTNAIGAVVPGTNAANGKVAATVSTSGAQFGSGSDISAMTAVPFIAYGKPLSPVDREFGA